MPAALTRRRNLEAPDECWHVYYGDVRVGTITIRTGNPHDTDPWEWHCGFYPGSHPVPVGNSILLATDIESGDAPALC